MARYCDKRRFTLEWIKFVADKIATNRFFIYGDIAQLARAPALQAGGPGFESLYLHQIVCPVYPDVQSGGMTRNTRTRFLRSKNG